MSGYSHLTAEERDRLADLRADGLSLRVIAKALGRAASTISREVRRNALESTGAPGSGPS
ncbi:helix-turn-helix domain-containing protein [Aurantimonas sp. C2-6-R+9]|uniref:helix-turn-helix domain-containing protein n=1 Tax=unclassified Aurantimonas TaxID=2638230 RepID=UPI002E1899E4|nr:MULTISPECIES: helix-turn-helix domain-containing protein [unclassified Aurantimonas]MEC5293302.1 helix-turn-helix domain-containing protein [Aurantimonas sp. C2-3-R2]MEC5383465.1 helix-turn-helix domain-containing protein [Aurantimonas sp. C2-6-R+9]MEC5414405.1 helix-turn-helix domain-containing protein [Aurantimonas sp. C2-4-R8]